MRLKAGALLLALTAASAVRADASGIAVFFPAQPDSPVQITGCKAGVDFSTSTFGIRSSALDTGVDFENRSGKAAVAVLFRLELSDGFGNVIDELFSPATGNFSPNQTILGNHWSTTDQWAGLGEVRCAVDRVRFADGSVWTEAPPTPPPGNSTPGPVPSRAP